MAGQNLLKKEFNHCYNRITECIVGAELYPLRRQFTLAAFLLHQAAEHAYTIIIRVVTGFRASTHNLDKLIRYSLPFSAELSTLFPRHTEKEDHLFRQLQKAYIYGRYKDDYVVTEKEMLVLT